MIESKPILLMWRCTRYVLIVFLMLIAYNLNFEKDSFEIRYMYLKAKPPAKLVDVYHVKIDNMYTTN